MSLTNQRTELAKIVSIISLLHLLLSETILKFFYHLEWLVFITRFKKITFVLFTLSGSYLFIKHSYRINISKHLNKKVFKLSPILIGILVLGGGLRFYKLGLHNFYEDEHQVIGAAKCFQRTQEFCHWDWISDEPCTNEAGEVSSYTRAWPHSWLIAQSFNIFGTSEFSARIPSALFGVFLILIVYYFSFNFSKSKKVALISSLLIAVHPSLIELSRYARMYALIMPIFLLQVWFSYNLIEEKNSIRKKVFTAAGLIVLTGINLLLHINTLSFSLGILMYLVFATFNLKQPKYRYYLIATTLGGFLFLFVSNLLSIDIGKYYLTTFKVRNFQYLEHFFTYPFSKNIGFGLFIIGLIYCYHTKSKNLLFLLSNIASNLIFFIFVANRYSMFNYSVHLVPVVILAIVWVLHDLLNLFNEKMATIVLLLLLFFIGANLYQPLTKIYQKHNGRPNYQLAYKEINQNYNDRKHGLFLQFPRTYYLQDLHEANIINLGTHAEYRLKDLLEQANTYKSGWISWAWYKRGHVSSEIREYADENFEKIHGTGVDETGVEVYYFDLSK